MKDESDDAMRARRAIATQKRVALWAKRRAEFLRDVEKFDGKLPRLSLAEIQRHPEWLSIISILKSRRNEERWREIGCTWGPYCDSFTIYAPSE